MCAAMNWILHVFLRVTLSKHDADGDATEIGVKQRTFITVAATLLSDACSNRSFEPETHYGEKNLKPHFMYTKYL